MKEKLKYIISLLLAASVGVWFMPLVRISVIDLSLMDVLKIGIGNIEATGVTAEVYESIQTYLEPYILVLLMGLIMILVEAFFTAVLSGMGAYIIATVSVVVNNVFAIVVYTYIRRKIEEVQNSIILFDVSNLLKFYKPTIIVWIVLYFIITVSIIFGIKMWIPGKKAAVEREIMPENFSARRNPWNQQNHLEEQDYLNQIQRLEREQKAGGELKTEIQINNVRKQGEDVPVQRSPIPYVPSPAKRETDADISKGFHGAILGITGIFAGKAYPLQKMTEVFFQWEEDVLVITPYREKDKSIAGIYFVTEYQEYCVEVFERRCFYLASGQPLGMNRYYYLPRGSQIYINEPNYSFRLA